MIELLEDNGGAAALAAASVAKSVSLRKAAPKVGFELATLPTDDTRPAVLLLLFAVLPMVPLDFDDLELLSLCDEEVDDDVEDGSLS